MSAALVVQTAWLGDVVLTTPLLDALAMRHDAIDVVTTPAAAPLVETHPAVRAVVTYDKRGLERGLAPFLRLAGRLRAAGYSDAYLPHRSVRSAMLAALARIPRRVGFADAPRLARAMYTEHRSADGAHEAERLRALAGEALPGPARLGIGLTSADRQAADRALSAGGIREPFVALNPGSARPTKRWPHYAALAERLAQQAPVVVLGAVGEGVRSPAPTPHPVYDLTGLSLRVSAAILRRARLAVTNDSVALHLAQATETPVLALFGPTAPSLGFGPRGPEDVALGLDLGCRPCSAHGDARCPLGHHRCLRELTVERVADVAFGMLEHEGAACG